MRAQKTRGFHRWRLKLLQLCRTVVGDHVHQGTEKVSNTALKFLLVQMRVMSSIQGAWATDAFKHEKWEVRSSHSGLPICACSICGFW
jgi:hypothetical protein